MATSLKPKLGASDTSEATAYDAALAMTRIQVADVWRPSKDNFLNRRTRDQLLSLSDHLFGQDQAYHRHDKKAALVDQFDRAFSSPGKSGRTPEQVERLKAWLPVGMGFDPIIPCKAEKGGKTKQAA